MTVALRHSAKGLLSSFVSKLRQIPAFSEDLVPGFLLRAGPHLAGNVLVERSRINIVPYELPHKEENKGNRLAAGLHQAKR